MNGLVCKPKLSPAFFLLASLATLLSVGCSTPVGMHGHAPDRIWQSECDLAEAALPVSRYAGPPIVLKRFENLSAVPVGGAFIVGTTKDPISAGAQDSTLSAESLSQAYAPVTDLALPVYEATFVSLRKAGCPVWKDYRPEVEVLAAPPGAADHLVLNGRITSFEVDTFSASEIHDGARIHIILSLRDRNGKETASFETDLTARVPRNGGKDVLQVLGHKLSLFIVSALNQRS